MTINASSGTSKLAAWTNAAELGMRWIGRACAASLFLLWGAFFIEHLGEWYAHPFQQLPPWWVGLSMVCHAGVLIGLGVMLFRAWPGAIITAAGTLGFIAAVAIGNRTLVRLPYLMLINLVPVGLALAAWWIAKRRRA